jgi:hypothetical protein
MAMDSKRYGKYDWKYGGWSMSSKDAGDLLEVRNWLKDAVEAKGALVDGSGVGFGQADIDIELNGSRYNVSIKPLETVV